MSHVLCDATTKYLKEYDSQTHCELTNSRIFQQNLFLKIQTAIKVALQIEKKFWNWQKKFQEYITRVRIPPKRIFFSSVSYKQGINVSFSWNFRHSLLICSTLWNRLLKNMVPVVMEITTMRTHELVNIDVVGKQSENRVRNANSPLSGQIQFDFSTDMRFKT